MGSERRTRAEAWIGRTLAGRYRLSRVIGVGGHGAVFEATHEWTKKRVAVKLLLPEDGGAGGHRADRFLREAKAATRVVHPNVVEIHDCGSDPSSGALYLAQEYLEGMDLRARLRANPPLGTGGALAVAVPLARALAAAHAQGVVHRDIKPGNVFLARSPQGVVTPKLIDFGISKLLDGPTPDGDDALTREGMLLGTPEYMAPEQARGELEVGPAVDQWALGVLLYEIVAGRRPFAGSSPAAILLAVVQGPPIPLDADALGVPKGLVEIIERAIEKHPAARFVTMESMADALEAVERALGPKGATLEIVEDLRPATGLGPDTLRPGDLPSGATDIDMVAPVVVKGTRVEEGTDDPFAGRDAPPPVRASSPRTSWPLALGLVLVAAGAVSVFALFTKPGGARPGVQVAREPEGRVPRSSYTNDASGPRARPTQPVAADLREGTELLRPAGSNLPDHLSSATTRVVMPPMSERFARCVPGWPGAVTARIRARGDGTVVAATVGGGLARTAAGRCVEASLRAERVPRFTAREQWIDWTWPRVAPER